MLRILTLAILLTSCSLLPPEDEKIILNDLEKVENDMIEAEIEKSQTPQTTSTTRKIR